MGPAPNTNPSGSKEEELGPEPPVNMSEGTCFLLIYTHLYSLHAVIKLRIQFILDLLKALFVIQYYQCSIFNDIMYLN